MSVSSSSAPVQNPTPCPADLAALTPDQLTALGGSPDQLEAVRTEVYDRLRNDTRKANFLTFRWLLPANEDDKTDAFDGLMAVCWRAAEARHLIEYFKARHLSNDLDDPEELTALKNSHDELREALKDPLVDRLAAYRALSPQDVIRTALGGGFRTDVDAANAARRRVRQEQKYLADDTCTDEDGESVTLFEFALEDPGAHGATSQQSTYDLVMKFIEENRAQTIEVLGDAGWQVLATFLDLINSDVLPPTERERERILTEAIAAKFRVKERQARTYKKRFRQAFEAAVRAGNPIFETIALLLGWEWRGDCRETNSDGNGS